MNSNVTVSEAAFQFLLVTPASQRDNVQREMNKFIRWCGKDRVVAGLSPHEIADYVDGFAQASAGESTGIGSVREFLAYLKKQGLTRQNLAVHLRVRKKATKWSPAQEREPQTVELTGEGLQRLREELEALKGQRAPIAEDLKTARADKDFRENAPLDAAREHQAHVESRIRELEAMLKNARLVKEQGGGWDKIGLGSRVTLQELGSGATMTYTLVHPMEVNLKSGKLSVESPLGKALLNRVPGEEIVVRAPAAALTYRIEKTER